MISEPGEALMLWTVRISVACYVIALWRWLFGPGSESDGTADVRDVMYDRFWFAAWLMCVVHMVCAFHFRHHWNHQAALQHTAQMTEDVVGWRWAGGLYINYVFLTVWGISAVAGLRPTQRTGTARETADTVLHTVTAFMMFNATAVFGPLWWSPVVLLVMLAVGWQWWSRRSGPKAHVE